MVHFISFQLRTTSSNSYCLSRVLLFFIFIIAITTAYMVNGQEWNYDPCTEGPEEWHLNYPICGDGLQQSPIDVSTYELRRDDSLEPLHFNWNQGFGKVFFNGETCQTNVDPNTMYISGGPLSHSGNTEQRYYMTQFHTHEVSEHHMDGMAYPLEIHFVHKNYQTGALAVVAFFFRVSDSDSRFLNQFIDFCSSNTSISDYLDFGALVSPDTNLPYITYKGSLTTPPCSEGVTWILIDRSFTVSRNQLKRFMNILPHHIANNRPIQSANNRTMRRYIPPGTDDISLTWSELYKLRLAIGLLATGFGISTLLLLALLAHKYLLPSIMDCMSGIPPKVKQSFLLSSDAISQQAQDEQDSGGVRQHRET